jgi:hypothetical protein
MANSKSWLSNAIPLGWSDVIIRSVKVAVVAFLVLQLEEFIDVGGFDTPASALDAGLIAAGIFIVNAILMLVKS